MKTGDYKTAGLLESSVRSPGSQAVFTLPEGRLALLKSFLSSAPSVGLLALTLVLVSAPAPADTGPDPRTAFWEQLSRLCGSRFEGYSSFPPDPDHSFAGKLLVATVETCTADEIRIPFAVGEDRSRTWILTRSAEGLSLKHDHRHEDGSPDEITMYGGWAAGRGTAWSQSFSADEHTRSLIPEAATNVWTLSLAPDGGSLTYSLTRHSQPRFEATLEAAEP